MLNEKLVANVARHLVRKREREHEKARETYYIYIERYIEKNKYYLPLDATLQRPFLFTTCTYFCVKVKTMKRIQ